MRVWGGGGARCLGVRTDLLDMILIIEFVAYDTLLDFQVSDVENYLKSREISSLITENL